MKIKCLDDVKLGLEIDLYKLKNEMMRKVQNP